MSSTSHLVRPWSYSKKIMGIKIKSLSLQILLPLCFHLPQLPSSAKTTPSPTTTTIKLIACDGHIKTFNKPIPASVLMKQNPLHLICRSDAFFLGQKVNHLSPHDNLQPGQSYFLLPSHFFHSVLSLVTLMSSNSSFAFMTKSNGFDVTKTERGIMLKLRIKEEKEREERVCTSEELKKEYKQLVNGGCQWKPKLEMIRERREISYGKWSSVLMLVRRRKKKKV